jgi:hypothetical protein
MSRRDKRRKRDKRKARKEQEGQGHHQPSPEAVAADNAPAQATRKPLAAEGSNKASSLSGVDIDSPPRIDRLEALSASAVPTAEGAWWIAIQVAEHVVELAALRDRHSGEPLARPLHEALRAFANGLENGTRPRPADKIHRAAALAHDAIRNIVASPRSRLVRTHEQRPVYALRELDARCMMWMARQPGRTVREKLGGRQHALAVVRRFSLDTRENRLLRRLIDVLMRRLDGRLSASGVFDEDGPCDEFQRAALALCRRALGTTGLAEVRPSEDSRPNNVLLGDPDYSRIWRAWLILRKAEDSLASRWSAAPRSFATAAFWAVASRLGTAPGAKLAERAVTLGDDAEDASGRAVYAVFAPPPHSSTAAVGWVEFVARGRFSRGQVKMLGRESGRPYGFVTSAAGRDFYFGPHTLREGTDFGSIHQAAVVMFRVARGGQESPPVDAMVLLDDSCLRSLDDGADGWVVVALTNGARVVVSAEELGDKRSRHPVRVGDKVLLREEAPGGPGARLVACQPASAKLVHAWQSGDRLGVKTCGLGASPGMEFGRVKFAKSKGDRQFGFLWGTNGEEHYFDPDSAGDVFYHLQSGMWVTFRRVSTWGGREAATEITIVDDSRGLTISEIREASSGEWTIQLPRGRALLPFRGTPISLISEHDGRVTVTGWGDLDGIRQVREAILRDVGIAHPPREETEDQTGPLRGLGIDASGWRVHFAGPVDRAADVLPYINVQHCEDTPEIGVVGRVDRSPRVEIGRSTYSLDPVFEGDDDPLCATVARQVFQSLPDEVGGHVETSAYVVPDDVDEFSQQALRAAVAGAFPNSLPVVKSVAATLAWQEKRFDGATVDDGDVVLVVTSDSSRLTATVLCARMHAALREALPATAGVYWERRPALAVDEYTEGLGGRALWLDYARRLVSTCREDLETVIDPALVADYLVDTGIVQEVAWTGAGKWLLIAERWFVVEHDHLLWSRAVQHWCSRFNRALEAGLGASLSSGMPQSKHVHLLLVGRPFDEPTVRSVVETGICSRLRRTSFTSTAFLTDEAGDLAAGAAAFSRRVSADLPVWRDWLPDLFLEIINNGLYDELELISGEAVDANLGSVHSVDIEGPIVLPAGHSFYEFSLVAGRANRRPMPVDLRLESTAFPLAEDTAVRLNLQYRYGVENGYELCVTPDDPQTAPFDRIVGVWGKASRAASPETAADARPPDPVPRVISREKFLREKHDVASSLTSIAQQLGCILADEFDVEELIASTTRRLRFLTRWMVDCGRLAEDDPAAVEFQQYVAQTALVKHLLTVVGIEGAWQGPSQRVGQYVLPDLRAAALVFLCSLGQQLPGVVFTWLRDSIATDEKAATAHASVAEAIGTLYRVDPSGHWIDALWNNVITAIEPFENPRLHGEAMGVLARQAWRAPNFVLEFAERTPNFVPIAVRLIERGMRAIASKAAQALDKESDVELLGGHVRGFQNLCELTLALLRLRGTEFGAGLAPGSPRMARLAKTVRMTDSLIVRAGKAPRTSLRLGVAKSEDLHRVSDLAYATNSFLLGAEGLNLIRIDAGDDED